jgi:hypothetical protein
VLSAGKEQLRIEPLSGGDSLTVAVGDVYRLPSSASELKQGQFAICNTPEGWKGCRIDRADPRGPQVSLLGAAAASLPASSVLAASPLTELNLKQAFAQQRARSEFWAAAERAGSPLRPPGFRPQPRARVVARRGSAWYSGVIDDVRDESAHVAFAPDGVREHVAVNDVVPEPPYATLPNRGDYTLVRPTSPSEPWQRVRVLGTTDRDLRVVDVDGSERVVTARDVLPLEGTANGAR